MYDTDYLRAFAAVMRLETIKKHKVKGDRGGLTNFGITEVYLREALEFEEVREVCGPDVSLDTLTLEMALRIFYFNDWKRQGIGEFRVWQIGIHHMQQCVVFGRHTPSVWLQKALASPHLDCDDPAIDGIVGPATRAEINKLTPGRNGDWKLVVSLMRKYATNHIGAIINGDESQRQFQKGWLNRINVNLEDFDFNW